MWTQHPLETEANRASRKKVKIVGYLDLLLTICLVIFLVIFTVLPLVLLHLSEKSPEWEAGNPDDLVIEPRLSLTGLVTTTAKAPPLGGASFMEENPLNSVHFWTGILLGIVVTFGLVGILAAVTLIKAVHYSRTNPVEADSMTRFWMHCNNAIIFTLALWLPFSFVLYNHEDGPCPWPYLLYLLVRLGFTLVVWRNKKYTCPALHYNLSGRKDIERQLYKPPTPRRRARFESYAMRYQFYEPALQLKPYQGGGNGFLPQCHCVRAGGTQE